jgi:hypothetical protein
MWRLKEKRIIDVFLDFYRILTFFGEKIPTAFPSFFE